MVQQACAQRGHDNRQIGNFPGAYSVFTLALETLQLKNNSDLCLCRSDPNFLKVYKLYFNSASHKW